MSQLYESQRNVFVRDLWPGGVGRRQGDDERPSEAPLWKVMPDSFDALCSWLVVERRPPPIVDPTRRHVVQYSANLEAPHRTFTFKVQGILQQFNLGTLGSWNRREMGAQKATRSITLSSGGCENPFLIQRAFLQHLKEFVIRTLDPTVVEVDADKRPTIYFRDNVFTRVRPGIQYQQTALSAMDDPHGHATRIASRWVVTHKTAMHSVLPSGKLARATALQFHLGDFVEVEAFPEIVTSYNNHKLKVDVFFVPVAVTRLCSASDATARGGLHLQHLSNTPTTSQTVLPPVLPPPGEGASTGDESTSAEWRAQLQASYFS